MFDLENEYCKNLRVGYTAVIMEISGTVIVGDGYGKVLGYPTANIDRKQYAEKKPDLKLGVYAGYVIIEDSQDRYRAGIVLGPMDQTDLPKIEAHLIGYTGDLYGEMVTFHFSKYLRPFVTYTSEEKLKADIKADIAAIMSLDTI
jgi:riboflavin kinase/FMN adenylyltransferase